MGMTITEKILADHTSHEMVSPGDMIEAQVDLAFGNDITAPIAIQLLQENQIEKLFDPDRILVMSDHFTPNKDITSATNAKMLRDFAREFQIHHVEVGRVGIEHVWLPEQGYVLPGMVVVGGDSHTCTYGALGAFSTGVGSTDLAAVWASGNCWFKVPETIRFQFDGKRQPWVTGKDLILYTIGQISVNGATYKAMEFTGTTISSLSMADRFTVSNMAIEAGAKNGVFSTDKITEVYAQRTAARSGRSYRMYQSDNDAEYADTFTFDAPSIELQVAFPHLPENAKPLSEIGEIPIDQVVIGSCTNGRIEDLAVAAKILHNQEVHPDVRCIIIPGTQEVYLEALERGYITSFIKTGSVVSTPTCGPCCGGHMGVLAEDERAVSTTNRNFVGRMGHLKSEVYLAGPAVAAASAILGRIAGPNEVNPQLTPPE